MSAPFAKMFGQSLWAEDSDFRTLPKDVQRVYFVLVTQPNISNCGVLPYNPRRWAFLASDETPESLLAGVDALAGHQPPFVVVDHNSDELWVRSWMKHDGLILIHNGAKGVRRSIESVLSRRLADLIRATAFQLAKETDRSLFEPPPKPLRTVTSDATRTPTTTIDNDSSQRPAAAAADGDEFDQAVEAALGYRRELSEPVNRPDRWEPAARNGIIKDYGKRIRQLLDQGHDPTDAGLIALGARDLFVPVRRAPEYLHPPECDCDGTGWVQVDPADVSRAAYSVPCTTVWPEATIHELRRSS